MYDNKYAKAILLCYMLVNVLAIHGCSKATVTTTVASRSPRKEPSPFSRNPSTESPEVDNPDTLEAKSDTPSKWLYSADGAVGCRIKKWYSHTSEKRIEFEFINIKSQQPVDIVYRVNSLGEEGKVHRLLNPGSDNQVSVTMFDPPLKKGESKIYLMLSKYSSFDETKAIKLLKLEIKDCRIKKAGESYTTLAPEAAEYYRKNPPI
jgi:hypothetical protein